jgi:hypothetical protein
MVLLDFNLELRKGSKSSMQVPLIAMLSTIKPDQNDGAILGVNIGSNWDGHLPVR